MMKSVAEKKPDNPDVTGWLTESQAVMSFSPLARDSLQDSRKLRHMIRETGSHTSAVHRKYGREPVQIRSGPGYLYHPDFIEGLARIWQAGYEASRDERRANQE